MPPVLDEEKCSKCGICVDICPQDVFYGSETGEYPKISYPKECWHCNSCVLDCPEDALSLRIPLSMKLMTSKE